MGSLDRIKPYERNVYYYETDRMGIVHHSNYIKWLEEARIDFMEQIGYPFKRIEDEGMMIPVLSVSCTYKKPMRYGEVYSVIIKPISFKGVRFIIEYEIINKTTKEICTLAESSHCFVDDNMKPISVKRKHPELYEAFMKYFNCPI